MARRGGGSNRAVVPFSLEDFRASLSYDPETGIFTNIVSRAGSRAAGTIAGALNKERGYIYIYRGNKNYAAHRLAWFMTYGYWPECIDHINGVRDDNRLANLRECTRIENGFNRPAYSGRLLEEKGVYFHAYPKHPNGGFWCAQISAAGNRQYLGSFAEKVDAQAAYASAAEAAFGQYQRRD